MTIDWNTELLLQLTWHWENQLRPRLSGLTDEEYLWEPVADCWSVRPRAEATTPMAVGGGDWVLDFALPEPKPVPITTIAWRIAHLLVGVAHVHSETDVDLDGLVELRRVHRLHERDLLGGWVLAGAIDLLAKLPVALAPLHPDTSTPIDRAVPSMIFMA